MNTLGLLVVAWTLAATSDAPPDAGSRKLERVAVYDLESPGLEPRVARIVTDAIVLELRKLQGLSVVSMDEVRAMLEHEGNKQLLGCSEQSCVAEIADALGVDTLITGSLTRVGEESIIGLRRLNQLSATSSGQATRRLAPQNGEEFLAAVGPLVAELFPEAPLRPGQTRGVDERLVLRVNPPPLPAWATLSTAAGAGVLLLSGVAAGTGLLLVQDEYKGLAALSETQTVPGTDLVDARNRGQALALATNVLGIAGITVAVAAGLMTPWTDWLGVSDE